jgi:hypothetical protein
MFKATPEQFEGANKPVLFPPKPGGSVDLPLVRKASNPALAGNAANDKKEATFLYRPKNRIKAARDGDAVAQTEPVSWLGPAVLLVLGLALLYLVGAAWLGDARSARFLLRLSSSLLVGAVLAALCCVVPLLWRRRA